MGDEVAALLNTTFTQASAGTALPTGLACLKKEFTDARSLIAEALKSKTPFIDFMVLAQSAFQTCGI
jgi:hypothetical protein